MRQGNEEAEMKKGTRITVDGKRGRVEKLVAYFGDGYSLALVRFDDGTSQHVTVRD